MTVLDVGLVGIIAAFAAIGALRGWLVEAMSLGVWLAAGVIAWLFAENAAPWFSKGIVDEEGQRILAFIALFVASFIALTLANFVLRIVLLSPMKNKWSRLFGALLGAVRGAALASILIGLGALTRMPQEPWWSESKLAPPLQSLTLALVSHLPSDVAGQLRF